MKKVKHKAIYFWTLIIVGIIIRILFSIRMTEINSDEIMTIMNAKSIIENGVSLDGVAFPTYLNGYGGQSVMLLYLMVLSFKLFGINLISARIPSFLISIFSLFLIYDFARKITKSEKIALISLFLVVISPWHIQQSIWALDCNLFCHALLLSIDIFYTGIIKNNKKYFYLSLPFYILSMYCYVVSFLFIPIFVIITLIYLKKQKKLNFKDILIFIISFLVFTMPLMITIILNLFKIKKTLKFLFFTMPYYSDLNRNTSLLLFSKNILKQLFANIKCLMSLIFFQFDNTSWNGSKTFGIAYHITLVFLIIGLLSCIRQKKYKFLLLYFSIAILDALIINYVNISRVNFLWYSYILLASIGIEKSFNKKTFTIISLYIFFFIFYIFLFFKNEYANIIYNYNFSNGFCESLKYSKKLLLKKIYYDNINKDESLVLYIAFLDSSNNKKYYELKNKKQVLKKMKNLKSNEAIIINYSNFKNINKYKKVIGGYIIIYGDKLY